MTVDDLFQPHLRKLANRYTKARDTTRARDRCSLVYCIWIPQMAYRSHGSILPIPCGSTYINGWPSELVSRCLSFRLLGLIERVCVRPCVEYLFLSYKLNQLTKLGFEIVIVLIKKKIFILLVSFISCFYFLLV